MKSEIYIGVMSGTSLDAVDVVAVEFIQDDTFNAEEKSLDSVDSNISQPQNNTHLTENKCQRLNLIATYSVPFTEKMRKHLLGLTTTGDNEIERMGAVCVKFGRLLGDAVQHLVDKNKIKKKRIRAVGCHGQTIRHRPDVGFSLQIGDPNIIAEITGLTVVADFRRRDIAAGGQGAPLVPAFHSAILQHQTINRVVLNLGGMANISVLPSYALIQQSPELHVSGFDTGPANVLLDAWCYLHTGQRYDENGDWASVGTVHEELFLALMSHPFLSKEYPKSTGREDFNLEYLERELNQFDGFETIEAVDVQATLLRFTAQSIADAILQTPIQSGELWLCGGGAYNSALWHVLASLLPEFTLHSTAEIGLAPTWVEATAFAWLARQRMLGLAGNLPAVTGAKGLRVLGGVY